MPRNMLQKSMKYAILVPHGLILLRVPKRRQTLGAQKNQRHAPCLQKTNRTAVGLTRASASYDANAKTWMAGINPAMIAIPCAASAHIPRNKKRLCFPFSLLK